MFAPLGSQLLPALLLFIPSLPNCQEWPSSVGRCHTSMRFCGWPSKRSSIQQISITTPPPSSCCWIRCWSTSQSCFTVRNWKTSTDKRLLEIKKTLPIMEKKVIMSSKAGLSCMFLICLNRSNTLLTTDWTSTGIYLKGNEIYYGGADIKLLFLFCLNFIFGTTEES